LRDPELQALSLIVRASDRPPGEAVTALAIALGSPSYGERAPNAVRDHPGKRAPAGANEVCSFAGRAPAPGILPGHAHLHHTGPNRTALRCREVQTRSPLGRQGLAIR